MKKQLNFHDKNIDIKLSRSAADQSQQLTSRLIIEIQIYFSCLLGKRLAFYSEQPMSGCWQLEQDEFEKTLQDTQQLTDHIYIRFNTVMTKDCPVSDYAGPPPVTDFTIRNLKPYVPSWLNIDYKNGQWSGKYGWPVTKASDENTKQVRVETIKDR
ncbi:MAG: hypothetical protein OQK76_03615 [Gammaproteobacteria bacterium]|nr:hypothetical protein [Gammaproteobacteria bacterium]MCW9056531.1 hypothetical protein [Gammaproteobacteria bacterium]